MCIQPSLCLFLDVTKNIFLGPLGDCGGEWNLWQQRSWVVCKEPGHSGREWYRGQSEKCPAVREKPASYGK